MLSFLDLYKSCFANKSITHEGLVQKLRNNQQKIYVLHDQNRAVSFVWLLIQPDIYEILDIGTDPQMRRTSHARSLLEFVKQEMKQNACQNLLLEVRQDNAIAIIFYESEGFILSGRRQSYYADGCDALLYNYKS